MLNGLDLFSGIGGLAVALEDYVKPTAYCEIDPYCQSVLLTRMASAQIFSAPIWDDINSLSRHFLPNEIDIIYGGFPCQDISVAGTGKGLEGERSGLFFEIVRLSKEIKPKFIFLENVPAIRTRGLGTVINELSAIGYDCRWTMLSAEEIGAPHKRNRWFLLAHARSEQLWEQSRRSSGTLRQSEALTFNNGKEESLADTASLGEREQTNKTDAESALGKTWTELSGSGWWTVEPDVGRVANGVPSRVDRIRGLGNAVVPLQAKTAFEILMGLKK